MLFILNAHDGKREKMKEKKNKTKKNKSVFSTFFFQSQHFAIHFPRTGWGKLNAALKKKIKKILYTIHRNIYYNNYRPTTV